MANPDDQTYILLIAGMHRSGTSAIAGLYNILGAAIGHSIMSAGPDNPSGFFENERIVLAHDELLTALGRSWDMDQPTPDGWEATSATAEAEKALRRVLNEEFDRSARVWLIKDPRICLFLPLWLKIARDENRCAKVVVALRHPDNIAASLHAREGMPLSAALNLTQSYLNAAAEAIGDVKAVVYEALIADPAKALDVLLEAAGNILPEPGPEQRSGCAKFFSDALHHHDSDEARSQAGAKYIHLVAGRGPLLAPRQVTEYLAAMRALPREQASPEEQMAYIGKLQLARTRRNLQYMYISSGAKDEAAKEIRMLENALQLSEYQLAQAQEEFRHFDKERAAKDRRGAVLERELAQVSQRNKDLSAKAADLENVIRATAARPFRSGIKSFIWGTARLGYRALPLTQNQKNALLSRFGSRLANIFPGLQKITPSFSREVVAPLTEAEINDPKFSFPYVPEADVSIIIPVYNQLGYTVRCLKSLANHTSRCTFEVIVMDDVSTDATPDVISGIEGVRYVRNEENLGFLRNCNKAAGLAKGNYLVFLNNDTVVLPGWLDALHDTFSQMPDVGLVGSKLIYPDGRLQEAGGIVWDDASGWNWGRLGSPDHPRYNYVRDADYVSGASIMIERQLFEVLGRFDERFAPAYYEDTDLAFSVRKRGFRVIYQPRSAIVHFEGISSGTDLNSGIKRYQVVNKAKFFDKWKSVIASHGQPEQGAARAADRRARKHVLIVDAVTPTPDQDSGSVDMVNLIRILIDLGWRVHFVPQTNYGHAGRYTDDLQKLGVECVYFPPYRTLDHYLTENGELFDMAIICREPVASVTMETVRSQIPRAKVIFYTVDLHYLRMERQAALKNDPQIAAAAAETKASEISLMRQSDLTILLSEFERDLITKDVPDVATAVLPLIRDIPGRDGDFQSRKDVVFIGGFNHQPNIDAVQWLVSEIWPRVREKMSGARLKICGSNMPESVRELCARYDDIEAVGFVADLAEVFNSCRLSVAPLRFGAGLKGKLATSFGYGVPCVTTAVAVEGMSPESLAECRLQGDTPEQLADLIVKYYSSPSDWERVSQASLKYVDRHFSYRVIKQTVEAMLQQLEHGAPKETPKQAAVA